MNSTITISLLWCQKEITLSAVSGQTILDAIVGQAELPIHAPCGGRGNCRKCTVYRITPDGLQSCLACQTPVEDGMLIQIPDTGELSAHLHTNLPLSVSPDAQIAGYGIACDIGTTTVICGLVDLETGSSLGTLGQENKQRQYGDDVISRISASIDGQQQPLTEIIRKQLAQMIRQLAQQAGVSLSQIHTMAVAANTTMCHLFAGYSPDSIGSAPYIPKSTFGCWLDASALDMPFSGQVYIAPAVSGYVGGDITADILAAGLDQTDFPTLLIDVGTNGEIALGCGDEFLCCSTAAGPVFEGAQIHFGMTAAPGAISAVEWQNGKVACSTVENAAPKGICGSGLIDIAAMLLKIGAVDATGRILDVREDNIPPHLTPHLFLLGDEPAFRLTGNICITQSDIRALQLGKAAIASGIHVLRGIYGPREIGQVLLAGGLGSSLRPERAVEIGMLPEDLLHKTRSIGNSTLLGAQMSLISQNARNRLAEIQRSMCYQELSTTDAFYQTYIDMMMFPDSP